MRWHRARESSSQLPVGASLDAGGKAPPSQNSFHLLNKLLSNRLNKQAAFFLEEGYEVPCINLELAPDVHRNHDLAFGLDGCIFDRHGWHYSIMVALDQISSTCR